MEKIEDILGIVIQSNLLADSLGELAEKLGYKGRSTFYRIIDGLASKRAIDGICQKLKETLFLDEDGLRSICSTIINTTQFEKIVKPFIEPAGSHSAFDVIDAFVSMDFSIFSEEFRYTYLNELLNLEREDAAAFYMMLAFFYYKNSVIEYYIKGETHRQRCARILESLSKSFIEKYPENGLAASMLGIYSSSEILNGETQILWSLIKTIADLIQKLCKPIEMIEQLRSFSICSDRVYWEGSNRKDTILAMPISIFRVGDKHFDIFKIDRENDSICYIGNMCFLNDEILTFYSVSQNIAKMSVYEFNGQELNMQWESSTDNPTGLGNKWLLLDKQYSQSLRILDRSISDERLYSEKLKAQGWKELPGCTVTDVVISREMLSIYLLNGKVLSISIFAAPFLHKIRTDYIIMIYERLADNTTFVCWPQIMHSLPICYFKGY